jgi:D-arabinose 1-dehydrogenase-like Zn-dependent alcohol dehydrogenase
VEGLFPISVPRVAGHDTVGRIDAVVSKVKGWTVGQLVGNVLEVPRRRVLTIGTRSAR